MPKPAVLITGATGGLGRNTALALAARGRNLLIGGRRESVVLELCKQLRTQLGVSARPFVADLSDLAALREAIAGLGEVELHGVVANAGITTMKDLRSADGFELTFAVNVLAHQLLLCELAPRVIPGGRVVIVASGVHEPDNKLARRTGVPVPRWVGAQALARPDQARAEQRLAPGPQRYSTSKLGNVLQARGLQRALHAQGRDIDVFAIDPGLMIDTQLARELPRPLMWMFRGLGRMLTPYIDNMRLSKLSAEHVTSLIEDESWRGQGFAYLDGDRVKPPSPDAQRDDLLAELWRDANALVGLDSAALPLTS